MKRLFVCIGMLAFALLWHTPASAQEDQYLRIYTTIQEGDALKNIEQSSGALAKYTEALTALRNLQRIYPGWNTKIVSYRLNYLASQISELSARTSSEAGQTGDTNAPPAAPSTNAAPTEPTQQTRELQAQLEDLRRAVEQLQSDKGLLEAKLKEALAAQPAVMDPREFARAEERIRELEKENGLLKVSIEQIESRPAAPGDAQVTEVLKQELAEANRKLAAQSQMIEALTLEKQVLQDKVATATQSAPDASDTDAARKSLAEANRRLAEQTEAATNLAREKEELQTRLNALSDDALTLAALRAENEILKRQITGSTPPQRGTGPGMDIDQTKAQIAALQSEKEILRLERIALEGRVKQLMASQPAPAVTPATATPAIAALPGNDRVRQIERERDDLRKQLEDSQRELYGRNNRNVASRISDLTGQLEVLRARLGVFEAQRVPYTAEELALFKKPQPVLAANPTAARKSVRELPAGTVELVREAQRDFAAGRFDRAEQKYLEVLKKDDRNVATLANLAAIQMEMGHLDQADMHIAQALENDPEDAYSLSILGNLRFRQGKEDEALDALSRAAKIDPDNAEIQNYLGLALGQKGMRIPAETALRRAIQLDPSYGHAHHNLAVIYVTQKPPAVELARFHYEKGLAAGVPKNEELEKLLNEASGTR